MINKLKSGAKQYWDFMGCKDHTDGQSSLKWIASVLAFIWIAANIEVVLIAIAFVFSILIVTGDAVQ